MVGWDNFVIRLTTCVPLLPQGLITPGKSVTAVHGANLATGDYLGYLAGKSSFREKSRHFYLPDA